MNHKSALWMPFRETRSGGEWVQDTDASRPRAELELLRGASPTEKDTDRLMSSLPYPADPSSRCSAPHVDGCPECVVNVEPPLHVERLATGCAATYLCADCGHSWDTAWGCS